MNLQSAAALLHRFRVWLLGGFSLLALAAVYGFNLGRPGQISQTGLDYYHAHASVGQALAAPLGLPHSLPYALAIAVRPDQVSTFRAASVLWALIAATVFFRLVRRWHGARTATVMTIMFGLSGWMLHSGRLAGGAVLLCVLPLLLLYTASWVMSSRRHGTVLNALPILLAVCLLIPGGIWFVLVTLGIVARSLGRHLRAAAAWQRGAGMLLLAIVLAGYAFMVMRSGNVSAWLGIAQPLPATGTIGRQLADSLLFLFVRGPAQPEIWLPHLALLDVFSAALCCIGIYCYVTYGHNLRARILALYGLVGAGLVAVGGAPAIGYLVPIAYLLAATGMTYLLHRWFVVFPHNPVARGIGNGLLYGVALVAVSFHLSAYFVAWQRSPAVIQAYTHRLPAKQTD